VFPLLACALAAGQAASPAATINHAMLHTDALRFAFDQRSEIRQSCFVIVHS